MIVSVRVTTSRSTYKDGFETLAVETLNESDALVPTLSILGETNQDFYVKVENFDPKYMWRIETSKGSYEEKLPGLYRIYGYGNLIAPMFVTVNSSQEGFKPGRAIAIKNPTPSPTPSSTPSPTPSPTPKPLPGVEPTIGGFSQVVGNTYSFQITNFDSAFSYSSTGTTRLPCRKELPTLTIEYVSKPGPLVTITETGLVTLSQMLPHALIEVYIIANRMGYLKASKYFSISYAPMDDGWTMPNCQ